MTTTRQQHNLKLVDAKRQTTDDLKEKFSLFFAFYSNKERMALKLNRNVSAEKIPRRTQFNREQKKRISQKKKVRRDVYFNGHLSNYFFCIYEIRERNHLTYTKKNEKHAIRKVKMKEPEHGRARYAIGLYQ